MQFLKYFSSFLLKIDNLHSVRLKLRMKLKCKWKQWHEMMIEWDIAIVHDDRNEANYEQSW